MVKGWEPPACSLRRNRFFACLPPQHCYSHGELQLLMQYLVSCMTEFLFPLGERSIFLQEHTQIRISSKHTLPVRHSCEAVKWHFHLWNGGGFLTAQQNLIVVRFFSPLLLHLVLFFPTVLWLPELAFSSPAFSDFFFFSCTSLKGNLHFKNLSARADISLNLKGKMKRRLYWR